MGKHNTVSFTQVLPKKRKRAPATLVVLVLVCLAVGLISFAVLWAKNDFSLEKTLGLRQNEVLEASEEKTNIGDNDLRDLTGSVNFLFICEKNSEITFCEMISVSPADSRIRVKPIAKNTLLETDDGACTLSELYGKISVSDICRSLGEKYVSIARYAVVTEDNYVKLLRKLGTVELVTERDYSYNVDNIKYTHSAGRQTFTAEMLLNFMKFADSGDDLLKLQANAAAAVIRSHFTAEKLSRGEEYFSTVINLVTSDITAFDFSPAKAVIEKMAENGIEVTVIS